MNLLRYLFHRPTWHKLPMMPRSYSVDYDARQLDADTADLMRISHVRCPQGVELLKRRHNLSSHELARQLHTRRRRRNVGARFMAVIRRAFGVTRYDPMRTIARQHMRRGAR